MDDSDLVSHLRESAQRAVALVESVPQDAWDQPTPCTEWSVRDLVAHLVYEWVWVSSMLEGRTVAEVGDRFDGDLLGSDPASAARDAAEGAVAAESVRGAADGVVHASFGDIPASMYLWQQLAEHVIHGWDLAAALGLPFEPDAGTLAAVTQWWSGVAELYRQAGVTAAAVPVPSTASDLDRFIADTGRDPDWRA